MAKPWLWGSVVGAMLGSAASIGVLWAAGLLSTSSSRSAEAAHAFYASSKLDEALQLARKQQFAEAKKLLWEARAAYQQQRAAKPGGEQGEDAVLRWCDELNRSWTTCETLQSEAASLTKKLEGARLPPGEAEIEVLVAKKTIPAEQRLKNPQDWVVFKVLPKALVPEGAFVFDPKQGDKEGQIQRGLMGQVFAVSLPPPSILTKNQLMSALPRIDPRPTWRAVGLKVDSEKGVQGFVVPKSRVDVLFSCMMPNGKPFSDVLLKNVLVLAVEPRSTSSEEGNKPLPQVLTLEVRPEQAQLLDWALRRGQLRLALRSIAQGRDIEGEFEPPSVWEKRIATANK